MSREEAISLAQFYIGTNALSNKTKIEMIRNLTRYLYTPKNIKTEGEPKDMRKEGAINLALFYINTTVLSDSTKIALLKSLQKYLQN